MNTRSVTRSRSGRLITAFALAVTVLTPVVASTSASAATTLTVAQALAAQDGRTATVTGYVVGQPTATTTVITSGYTADTAIALADSAAETGTGRMLYVQVTAAYRSAFGLLTNPGLRGRQVTATGTLTAYFSHGGLKNPTAMSLGGATPGPTPTPTASPNPSPSPTGGGGPYDSTYYASAIGKTGTALRSSLHAIIRTQTKLNYDQVWEALKDTDQDPANANNVLLLYSGRSQSKTSNGGDANDWNREHVWAKSHGDFGTATGPGTDVHHLRPEDVSVNSTRGNKDFDAGGSGVSECTGCYSDADSFEPRNAVKGDVARMIMYMAIRYEGDDGWPNLEINNSVSNGTSPYHGKLSVLLAWNLADPPDAFEKRRNQVIYDRWQGNRNPFVDHPEWATAIWG
ncbi:MULTISPECIES: endonuclease [unclassified Micromonospora]|uniref:endonuclease n=1 Tax=unclassified Micromonospora TaxID=2617518 RepID=UPI00098D0AC0|nr:MULTISPECIES: endonuclease [unclassified Micromonospora]MDI5939719.1 endonuclease [Micromonospora sp. DH15]OON31868.1 ribonuclease [Micromonospora sp. Rc5]